MKLCRQGDLEEAKIGSPSGSQMSIARETRRDWKTVPTPLGESIRAAILRTQVFAVLAQIRRGSVSINAEKVTLKRRVKISAVSAWLRV